MLNALQAEFELVVATQDWHPRDHLSFASQYPGAQPGDIIQLNHMPQNLWPDHCVQGTCGAGLSAELETNLVEAIFRKGMNPGIDSYSGFFDNGRLKTTGLADYLKGRCVDEVVIGGLAADFCVYFTAMDALDLGFKTTILKDATRAIDPDVFEHKAASFVEAGGTLL